MEALVNKVQLVGNLGMNPEVVNFDSGKSMAKFSLATSSSYKNKAGEKIEDTQWHRIVVWGKSAEIAEKYLKKGSKVMVEGKLSNRSYEDKEGNKRFSTEIVANNFLMLGGKVSE